MGTGGGVGWEAREGGVVRQRGDGGGGKEKKNTTRLDRFAFTPDVLVESGGRAGRGRQAGSTWPRPLDPISVLLTA